MRQIMFNLQFRGTAVPSGSEKGILKATTSAASCTMRSVVTADGVEGSIAPAEGGLAFFESEVRILSPESFTESGTIGFGDGDHGLRFSTVGQGHLGPSADPKYMAGAVTWKVEGGEGQFEGATGLITSNFVLSEHGDVVDHQFGVIFVK